MRKLLFLALTFFSCNQTQIGQNKNAIQDTSNYFMKNLTILFLVLIFSLIIACNTKEQKIGPDYFRNKTFTFYTNDTFPPFKLNFDDSTCFLIDESPTDYSWKLNYYNNSNFLILNNIVFGIKLNPKGNDFELINIEENNHFKVVLEKAKYKKESFIGEWIFDQIDSYNFSNSEIPPPPPTYESNENGNETWPPKLTITKDSIFYEFLNFRSKSKYKLDNSNQFIFLNLYTESSNKNHVLWEIEQINDTFLYIKSYIKNSEEIRSIKLKKSGS